MENLSKASELKKVPVLNGINMSTLYLIRGVPGSGKSSLARDMLDSCMVDVHYEADMYFVNDIGDYQWSITELGNAHRWCQDQTHLRLSMGWDVAVSNTTTTEKEVETYRKIAEKCNARFVSLVVESRHDGENIHGVPPEKVEQMRKRFSVKV